MTFLHQNIKAIGGGGFPGPVTSAPGWVLKSWRSWWWVTGVVRGTAEGFNLLK